MITVVEVKTKRQQKDFLDFPNKLYKNNPYYVPPLYMDEKKIFRKDYLYHDTCEDVFFNAYDDGKIVGRISGILQKAHNLKTGENRIRFTRFDSVDSQEVANALFDAVFKWGKEKGADIVFGPLGYSDLEREGLLVEGFEELSTFEEQYNYEYYQHLIENYGFEKDVDWVEFKLYKPDEPDTKLKDTVDYLIKKNNLHFGEAKNVKEFINKYVDQFFNLLDETYENIYGTVPFTDSMKKLMISNFKLMIDLKHVNVILDENENVVCLGISFPSIAEAVRKSNGHLTPLGIIRILKSIKHPKVIDLGLVGVSEKYMNKGINAAFVVAVMDMLENDNIDHCETNLNLEDNYRIINCWKRFNTVQHKRRRSYIKRI